MYGRKHSTTEPATPDAVVTPQRESTPPDGKKNRPTPTRREQEAARKRPLVASANKADRSKAKAQVRQERDKARIGVMQGDERFLTSRDAGPQRRYVRDYVDARFSIGEIFIPLALVVLLFGMLNNPTVQITANIAVYAVIFVVILDCFWLNFTMKRKMRAKFGEKLDGGLTFYAVMRAIQMRPLRIPKPQVKRGAYPK